ncbi:hypothetical protein LUZ60_013087 [Juncus effusus]|nr:hypothetical protein LUZ60_013087 [Juncus effusus]
MASSSFLFLFSTLLLLSSSSMATDSKVPLALYYESLCPYCANFIVNDLAKIFHNGLISIVDLDLVPYGNARVSSNGTITCQNVHFAFINCLEDLALNKTQQDPNDDTEWRKCFSIDETKKLDPAPVLECTVNGTGHQDYAKFQAAVCKAYKGDNRPKVCDEHEHLSNFSEEKKLRNAVSLRSEISLPDAMNKENVD